MVCLILSAAEFTLSWTAASVVACEVHAASVSMTKHPTYIKGSICIIWMRLLP